MDANSLSISSLAVFALSFKRIKKPVSLKSVVSKLHSSKSVNDLQKQGTCWNSGNCQISDSLYSLRFKRNPSAGDLSQEFLKHCAEKDAKLLPVQANDTNVDQINQSQVPFVNINGNDSMTGYSNDSKSCDKCTGAGSRKRIRWKDLAQKCVEPGVRR